MPEPAHPARTCPPVPLGRVILPLPNRAYLGTVGTITGTTGQPPNDGHPESLSTPARSAIDRRQDDARDATRPVDKARRRALSRSTQLLTRQVQASAQVRAPISRGHDWQLAAQGAR